MNAFQPGQVIGPYQIINQIGKGGMATVYKAYQPSMERYVAIKIVSAPGGDDQEFHQRFRQEARLIARLEHPRILPVYDYGEAAEIPYLVMRFLDAGTLKERMAAGGLTLADVDRLFLQLADALAYAHENGVIHRDIKPSNAMLDKRGDVFLTDFGVAKLLENSPHLTATGAITGTPAYMSPEQAQGLKLDQRTDIYSLGIVLYEMLTGRVPFEAETPMAVIFKQIQDPPPPLSLVRGDLPASIEAVLLKALAKNVDERFATMPAFIKAWKTAIAEASAYLDMETIPPGMSLPPVVSPPPAFAPVPPPPAPVAPIPAQVTPPSPVAVPALAAKKFPWLPLAVVGLVALVFALLFFFLRSGQPASPTPGANGDNAATPANPASLSTASPAALQIVPTVPALATALPTSGGTWESWTAANSVYSIALLDEKIYTAGVGGVTVWNADGSAQQITMADGLPSAWTDAVYADPQDNSLWVGTSDGLAHFDGKTFTTYYNELDSGYVTAIVRRGDRLWAGTNYCGALGCGLQVFDGQGWEAARDFPSAENPGEKQLSYNLRALAVDQDNAVWAATDHGLGKFDDQSGWQVFTTADGLPDNAVYSLLVDRENRVWAGTPNSSVAVFDRATGKFEALPSLSAYEMYDIRGLAQAPDGRIWIGGYSLVIYDPATQVITPIPRDEQNMGQASTWALAFAQDGTLYVGTEHDGMLRYSQNKFTRWSLPNRPSFAAYSKIVPGEKGELYFLELYHGGADLLDATRANWQSAPSERGLPLALDAQNRLWSAGDGVWIFAPGKNTHLTTEQGLPSNEVNTIAVLPDGKAFIGTNSGLAYFDGLKVTAVYTKASNGLLDDSIYTLFLASDGSLWMGFGHGFSHRLPDGQWEHFTGDSLFGNYSGDIRALAEDRQGGMWVATASDGIYSNAGGQWQHFRAEDPGVNLPGSEITTVKLAPDGALWFGVAGGGIVRFDGKNWELVGQGKFPCPSIYDIFFDADGSAWFATCGGVTHFRP